MTLIRIRQGTTSDAARLAEFAARTFRETFEAENRREDMELFLARTFGVEQQTAELGNPSIITLLAEHDDDLAAYTQLHIGSRPALAVGPEPAEIGRFYVDPAFHGQGVAQTLMLEATEAAKARGARTIWLGVWEKNPRAIAFYNRCGFSDAGSHVFLLGNDPQIDRIMIRTIRS